MFSTFPMSHNSTHEEKQEGEKAKPPYRQLLSTARVHEHPGGHCNIKLNVHSKDAVGERLWPLERLV